MTLFVLAVTPVAACVAFSHGGFYLFFLSRLFAVSIAVLKQSLSKNGSLPLILKVILMLLLWTLEILTEVGQ